MLRAPRRPALTEDHVPAVLLRLALPMMAVSLGIIIFNLTGLFAGAALANFLSGILGFVWFERRIANQDARTAARGCVAQADGGA